MRVRVETGEETLPFSILETCPFVRPTSFANWSRVTLRSVRRARIFWPICNSIVAISFFFMEESSGLGDFCAN